jgi:hypothetical protein
LCFLQVDSLQEELDAATKRCAELELERRLLQHQLVSSAHAALSHARGRMSTHWPMACAQHFLG